MSLKLENKLGAGGGIRTLASHMGPQALRHFRAPGLRSLTEGICAIPLGDSGAEADVNIQAGVKSVLPRHAFGYVPTTITTLSVFTAIPFSPSKID